MMTGQSGTLSVRKNGAASANGADSEAAGKLTKLARSAGETGKTVGKASLKLAKPVANSLKKQSPDTLAKMLIAAAAPRLIEGAIRIALRNPGILLLGAAVAAFAISRLDDDEAAAT